VSQRPPAINIELAARECSPTMAVEEGEEEEEEEEDQFEGGEGRRM
jgi:hypothetical protein